MAKDLTSALHALTMQAQGQTSRKDVTLPAATPVTKIPPRTGSSSPATLQNNSGGTGGQFGESDPREFWPERAITSTDGLFVIKVKPIKKMVFENLDDPDNANKNLTLRFHPGAD